MNTLQKSGNWIYITPIYNLELTKVLKGEFSIGRVTFVDIEKIPLIRKRLGFPLVFSKIKNSYMSNDFFNESKTYAILSFKGIPKEKEFECRGLIEDAVNILSLSQLGYCTRRRSSQFGLVQQRSIFKNYILNKGVFDGNIKYSNEKKVLTFHLDEKWQNFHKQFFFFELISIIYSSKKIQTTWRDTIKRATIMVGKSMQSIDLEYCFLWNMIIIEMLLTEQGDKYSERLPERVGAFIDWVSNWDEKNYKQKIQELYKKRCEFVHDGNSKNIKVEDVLFTDNLIFNILWNIIKHIQQFPTKDSITSFSDKVKAEKLLGMKSKVQPKTLMFMAKEYCDDDLIKI